MNSNVLTLKAAAGFDTGLGGHSKVQGSIHANLRKHWSLDRLLFIIGAILEYAFGLYVGAVIGWTSGWYAGSIYVECTHPVYFSNAAELSEIVEWARLAPCEFGDCGKLVGAVAGAIAIMITNRRLHTKQIVSLYENGVTEPEDIARALGKSVRRTRRKLIRLHRCLAAGRKGVG
jgi:hypothetical protein